MLEPGESKENLLQSRPRRIETLNDPRFNKAAQLKEELGQFDLLIHFEVSGPYVLRGLGLSLVCNSEHSWQLEFNLVDSLLVTGSAHIGVDSDFIPAAIRLHQVVRGAMAHDASIDHDSDLVAKLLSFVHTMRRQQNARVF